MSKFINIRDDYFKIDDIEYAHCNVNKENEELYDLSVHFINPFIDEDEHPHYKFIYKGLSAAQYKEINLQLING